MSSILNAMIWKRCAPRARLLEALGSPRSAIYPHCPPSLNDPFVWVSLLFPLAYMGGTSAKQLLLWKKRMCFYTMRSDEAASPGDQRTPGNCPQEVPLLSENRSVQSEWLQSTRVLSCLVNGSNFITLHAWEMGPEGIYLLPPKNQPNAAINIVFLTQQTLLMVTPVMHLATTLVV